MELPYYQKFFNASYYVQFRPINSYGILQDQLKHTVLKSVSQSTYIIVDIDECSLKIDDCDQDCINTAGDYDCLCFDGYFLDTSNDNCEGMFSSEKIVYEKMSDYYNCNNRKRILYYYFNINTCYFTTHYIQYSRRPRTYTGRINRLNENGTHSAPTILVINIYVRSTNNTRNN